MRQPAQVTWSFVRYLAGKMVRREKRFPLVLMLEPLYQCNLRCHGCGKVRQTPERMKMRLTKEECFEAIEECGAPAVSIAGGEPLMLDDIGEIVSGMIARDKLTLLCTNGLLMDRAFELLKPDPRFSFVFHLDGLKAQHDAQVDRDGVFEKVMDGIEEAKRRGFRVSTNTTLFKESSPEDVSELLRLVTKMGVDASIISPAFDYENLEDEDGFLGREAAQRLFRAVESMAGKVNWYDTPTFRAFLRGDREMSCTPWGNPTRDPLGWQGPCYLLSDAHYETFAELMEKTDWDRYGYGKNPRCAGCAMHSGYEASAVRDLGPKDVPAMVGWMAGS